MCSAVYVVLYHAASEECSVVPLCCAHWLPCGACCVCAVRTLHHFHQQLSYCVSQFVDKDPELSVSVLQGLLRYWPVSNSAKEVLFLNELEQVLELTQPEEFGLLVVPLFRRVALSIASPHFQVAERALFLWHNEYISHLIAQHREDILPLLYPVLAAASHPPVSTLTNGQVTEEADSDTGEGAAAGAAGGDDSSAARLGGHWNPTVNNLTQNVLKIFVELDASLVENVREDGAQKAEQRDRNRQERKREWKRLEDEERKTRKEGRLLPSSSASKPDEAQQQPEASEAAIEPAEAATTGDVHTHQVGDLFPSTALHSPPVVSAPPPPLLNSSSAASSSMPASVS